MKEIADRVRQLRTLCHHGDQGCGEIVASLLEGGSPSLRDRQKEGIAGVAVAAFTGPGGCGRCPEQIAHLPESLRARVHREGRGPAASPSCSLALLRSRVGESHGLGALTAGSAECEKCGRQMPRKIGGTGPLILEHGAVLCSACLNVKSV